MSSISADSYSSRANSGGDSGSTPDLDRFMNTWVRPSKLPSTYNEHAPEREVVGPDIGSHVLASRGAARPESSVAGEVHGAMHSIQTTLRHDSAALGENGFPSGWQQAAPHPAAK